MPTKNSMPCKAQSSKALHRQLNKKGSNGLSGGLVLTATPCVNEAKKRAMPFTHPSRLSPSPGIWVISAVSQRMCGTACQPSPKKFRIGWRRPQPEPSARLLSRALLMPSDQQARLTSGRSTSTGTTRCLSMTRSWPRKWVGLPSSQIRVQSLRH